MRVHVDTDFAGNPDDACALAMLLGWPGVEVVAVTTTDDPDGRRAGYVASFLGLAGRSDIPIAVGAGRSLTTSRPMGRIPDHDVFWGDLPRPVRGDAGAATLLQSSIAGGAMVVALGPYTNLAALEQAAPGTLGDARVVAMGGWVGRSRPGLPHWGPERDWNVQADPEAARIVLESCEPVLATLTFAVDAVLRERDLPRLMRSGPVGQLLTRQSLAHGRAHGHAELGRAHEGLPDDLVNFHWDPAACAVAVGWEGAAMRDLPLRPVTEDGVLRLVDDPDARPIQVLGDLDRDGFAHAWVEAVERAQR